LFSFLFRERLHHSLPGSFRLLWSGLLNPLSRPEISSTGLLVVLAQGLEVFGE
jgi:hypothetical protein